MEKDELFESMGPSKALAIMALPTVASQLVILLYNLADTWFIGRANDPYLEAHYIAWISHGGNDILWCKHQAVLATITGMGCMLQLIFHVNKAS